ncbi:MAG: hypothetical protein FJ256_07395 [Phycisphaerae bacterium]|nr:hypothetical protein [Phycisphaerae bacterium]
MVAAASYDPVAMGTFKASRIGSSTRAWVALVVAIAFLEGGCASAGTKGKKKPTQEQDPQSLAFDGDLDLDVPPVARSSAGAGGGADATDPNQKSGAKGTFAIPGSPGGASTSAADRRAGGAGAPTDSSAGSTAVPGETLVGDDKGGRWGVLLLSFTGEEHLESAKAACRQLRQRYPLLKDSYVREKSNGSIVLVGQFTAVDDPAAKPLAKQVQALRDGDERPFARAFLTRVEPAKRGSSSALELRRLREENPDVRELYSLEVAVWSDFGSGEISLDEIRRQAEAYTKKLRAQGYMAFYQHDDDKRMSMVTVGAFGRDAYDAKTMVYSDEVEAIRKNFPKLLVNGEELLRPVMRGSKETTPERPILILVPN